MAFLLYREEKENIKKRRREQYEIKKAGKALKKTKTKDKPHMSHEEVHVVRKKQKCSACDDELDHYAEEEGEKNVGCDKCSRWYVFYF